LNQEHNPKENQRQEQPEAKDEKDKKQKGDTSNRVRMGTFLGSVLKSLEGQHPRAYHDWG